MASKPVKQSSQNGRYENVQVNSLGGGTLDKSAHANEHPHSSDPCKKVDGLSENGALGTTTSTSTKTTTTCTSSVPVDAKSGLALRDAKLKLLMSSQDKGDCPQCKELSQLLALWELGVGGIARNCSRILAQLNKARIAHQALECRLREKAELESSKAITKSLNVNKTQRATYRKSMYNDEGASSNSGSNGSAYLAGQMYPTKESERVSAEPVSSLSQEHYLEELQTHLGQAIDLCQQLAAACFKSNQSVSTNVESPHLRRKPTAPPSKKSSSPSLSSITPPATPYRPPLQPITEERSAKKHKSTFIRTASSPVFNLPDDDLRSAGSDSDLQNPSKENEKLAKKMVSSGVDDGWVKVHAGVNGNTTANIETSVTEPDDEDSKPDTGSVSSKSSLCNPVLSILGVNEKKQLAKEAQKGDRDESSELILSSSSGGSDNVRDSILSTYSDSDVKQVMSKIAGLEEERIKLLDTIDKLQHDNQVVCLHVLQTHMN